MTFPSVLISAPTTDLARTELNRLCQELDNHISPNNPDIFSVTDYTIATIRLLKKFLSQKPYQHQNKIVIIESADLLLAESQNALLKMLEEPGNNNYFLLTSTRPNQILSTVISRCQLIKIGQTNSEVSTQLISPSGQVKTDLRLTETVSPSLEFFESQINAYHQELIKQPSQKLSRQLNLLNKCLDMVKHHVDPKSALDYFLLER